MAGLKSLAKDTAIYGLSSILGKFLNWCFVFLYINVLKSTSDYGIVTNLYAYMALLLIILTYGMETGFFRFANDKNCDNPLRVYSTTLISIASTSALFIGIVALFLSPISTIMGYPDEQECVLMLAIIIAIDAFISIPFAYLRYQKKALRFATLKLINIALNIALNLFFFLLCPFIYERNPEAISWFFSYDKLVYYIFVSNLISSAATLLMLLPQLKGFKYTFDKKLWRTMIRYSLPILILGIAGIMNQTFDKIFYPHLAADRPGCMEELGIYGAVFKIAIVMVMFTQAFRFAYEPFIFAKNKNEGGDAKAMYALTMKYFIVTSLLIFMGVMFYIDIVSFLMPPAYFKGIHIVPVIMAAEVFFGIIFNLSLWYKLTDRTQWGAYLAIFGFIILALTNILFVPQYGYEACAWASFICYFAMMIASYLIGQHYYPIAYPLKEIGLYTMLAAALYAVGMYTPIENTILKYTLRTTLLLIYVIAVTKPMLKARRGQ
ncbi:MAG: oligosaccharide flippase family protein [Bacteroidales bacterium]|nr:oligosaccharide flippase family protein [Bacteroidales bacterium]